MRDFLGLLKEKGLLRHEACSLDEVPELLKRNPTEAFVLDVGRDFRLVSGYCSTRERIALALGCKKQELLRKVASSHQGRGRISHTDDAPCQQNVKKDMGELPIPALYRGMKPYICAGVVAVNDEDHGPNLAFHRLMVAGANKLVVRICERDTYAYLQAQGELDAAIAIGVHPSVLLAAATSLPIDKDEYEIASRLNPLVLTKALTVDLDVPANAEIVLEGRITSELADEGPFVDITGTMDPVRKQHVFEIKKMTHRDNPMYHQIVPALPEHKLLMGMPREPAVFNAVNAICDCRDVSFTSGSCGWLHGAVSIRKKRASDGINALRAAFKAHPSMKHCIAVDDDIDVTDPEQLEWAMATRFQGKRDMLIFEEKGSTLDPSAAKDRVTSKLGFDATIPLNKDRKDFLRV